MTVVDRNERQRNDMFSFRSDQWRSQGWIQWCPGPSQNPWKFFSTAPVMGISQLRLGFKSRFESFWQFDLRCKDLIWNTVIRFVIWFENFGIRFDLKNSYVAGNRNNGHSLHPKEESRVVPRQLSSNYTHSLLLRVQFN